MTPAGRRAVLPGLEPFQPRLDVLQPEQRRAWNRLSDVPLDFVLYGGTGLALRLGHRASRDFDLFASRRFVPGDLLREVPFLRGAHPLRSAPDTLIVEAEGVVLSFFGVAIGAVGDPSIAADTGVPVASLEDLAATKTKALLDRAESKDYLDLCAIFDAGVQFAACLAYASAVFGPAFEPMLALKAAASFEDGDLPGLPERIKRRMRAEAAAVTDIEPVEPRHRGVLPFGLPRP